MAYIRHMWQLCAWIFSDNSAKTSPNFPILWQCVREISPSCSPVLCFVRPGKRFQVPREVAADSTSMQSHADKGWPIWWHKIKCEFYGKGVWRYDVVHLHHWNVSGVSEKSCILYRTHPHRCLQEDPIPDDGLIPSKHDTLKQCWLNVGPSSAMVGQHQASIVSMCRVCWDCPFSCRGDAFHDGGRWINTFIHLSLLITNMINNQKWMRTDCDQAASNLSVFQLKWRL